MKYRVESIIFCDTKEEALKLENELYDTHTVAECKVLTEHGFSLDEEELEYE